MIRSLRYLLILFFLSSASPVSASDEANLLSLDGHFTQGGLVVGKTLPKAKVEVDGKAVRVSPEGLFLIGFNRDAPDTSALQVRLPDGRRIERVLNVEKREYEIQRIDGLPKRKVTPEKRDWERIRAETAMVKKARQRDDARSDFANGFIWPSKGRISGVYGSQRVLNGEPRRPHFGIDIAAPIGTPVVAPADGVVSLAQADMFYSGGTLLLDHGHGLSSAFLHLDQLLVKPGDQVKQGDLIAKIGSTGRVTGPHLDWRINLFTKRLDPALLVGPM